MADNPTEVTSLGDSVRYWGYGDEVTDGEYLCQRDGVLPVTRLDPMVPGPLGLACGRSS